MHLADISALRQWPVKDFYDRIWSNACDAAITELIAPDINANLPAALPGVLARGIGEFRGLVHGWHEGFSDMIETPFAGTIGAGSYSVAFRFEGTHSGDFEGIPPSGRRASMIGIDMFVINDRKIVEWICVEDFEQLKLRLRR